MYKKFLKEIMEKNKGKSIDEVLEMMKEYNYLMEEMLDVVKYKNPELYKKMFFELYEMLNGKILTEEYAEKWVNQMKPFGEYWDIETISDVLKKNGMSEFNPVQFYVWANMMKNDFYNTIGENDMMYVKLAKNKMEDEDAPENALYEEFKIKFDCI